MKGYILVAILGLLVASCSHRPIPVAKSYPITGQQKMQAAHHWDVLATDVANRLKKTMELTFPNAETLPPVFVKITNKQEEIPFGKAFYNLLNTKLVQQSLVVLTNDAGFGSDTLVVGYDMQVVHHKDRRLTYPPPGAYTALAGGVWMVANAINNWAHPGLVVLPFTLAADADALLDYYLPGETNTEVIITTSVTMSQQYVFGDSRMYYVNTGDYDHYEDIDKTYQVVN
ncbi:MAG: hypothetical protein IMF12_08175 [Proteobacteria bacterium]|nr:hypothetical protein [Pseudomonadota bacterium]